MRLGVVLPARDLAGAATRIEAAGFDSAWVFDAVGRGFLLPEPLIALSVAAAVTERIELGTGVLQVPLRNPVDLAHRVLTAQLLCGGRLRLGVGAGSTPADFQAMGGDFASRFRTLDASLTTMRTLWSGEAVGGARIGTWPSTQGGPPIYIGAWAGSRWIARAARDFDGWVASGAKGSWQKVADGIARFRDLGGKRAILTNVVVDVDAATASASGPDDAFDLICPPDVARQRLAYVAGLGYDDVVLVTRHHDAVSLSRLRHLLAI